MSTTKLGVCFRFQSEKETGDRNYAIGYYLKEKKVTGRGGRESPWEFCGWCKGRGGWGLLAVRQGLLMALSSSSLQCFPKGVDMMAALDLYFQVSKRRHSGSRV